jgi:hypothetical protein
MMNQLKYGVLLSAVLGATTWGQSQGMGAEAKVLDLPSVEAPAKIPGMDKADPKPDLSGVITPSSGTSSIPQPRPPLKDPALSKNKDSDWAAEAMMAKQEALKKKQAEDAEAEEKKAKETEAMRAKEEKEKKAKDMENSEKSTVTKNSLPGWREPESAKLPPVTGMDGVKPRAMDSGDGRVQQGFDSFTGPSSSSPLGKDYQSGAKPIMPPSGTYDSRMAAGAPKLPEVPSGSYQRISQDPYSMPPGSEAKKPVPTQPKKNLPVNNPPPKNPLGAANAAGYSPYDNLKNVSDPRNTRRF